MIIDILIQDKLLFLIGLIMKKRNLENLNNKNALNYNQENTVLKFKWKWWSEHNLHLLSGGSQLGSNFFVVLRYSMLIPGQTRWRKECCQLQCLLNSALVKTLLMYVSDVKVAQDCCQLQARSKIKLKHQNCIAIFCVYTEFN